MVSWVKRPVFVPPPSSSSLYGLDTLTLLQQISSFAPVIITLASRGPPLTINISTTYEAAWTEDLYSSLSGEGRLWKTLNCLMIQKDLNHRNSFSDYITSAVSPPAVLATLSQNTPLRFAFPSSSWAGLRVQSTRSGVGPSWAGKPDRKTFFSVYSS